MKKSTTSRVFLFAVQYHHEHGYAASLREMIAAGLGLKSMSSVRYQLQKLVAMGLMQSPATDEGWGPSMSRCYVPVYSGIVEHRGVRYIAGPTGDVPEAYRRRA